MLNCFNRGRHNDDEDDDIDDEDGDESECEMDEEEAELAKEAGATSNPKDYYFKAIHEPENATPIMIIITPKKYFDTEGFQWDQHVSTDCGGPLDLPDYEELTEGVFGPVDDNATIKSIEKDLKSRGFIHNPKLL